MAVSRTVWRRVLRRELLALYAVVFLADITLGLINPLFPLLARGLGASLTLLGALTAISGGLQVLVGLPIGGISDRWGRRNVIVVGTSLLATAALILALAASPLWLAPAQMALGVAIVAVFVIGAALAGDLSTPQERNLVFGLYASAMGLGVATGPLIGSHLAEWFSTSVSLLAAMCVALMATALAAFGLPRITGTTPPRAALRQRLALLWNSRALRFACIANFLFNPIYAVVISTFVPLQGVALGFSIAAIGSLFSIRALASTGTRLPTGMICTPRWSHRLMLGALALAGATLLVMAATTGYTAYLVALAVEGITFGVFLTAGQAFVAQRTAPESLGAALGTYTMAGGISATLSPFVFGAMADAYGIPAVFWLIGVLAVLGAAALAAALGRARGIRGVVSVQGERPVPRAANIDIP